MEVPLQLTHPAVCVHLTPPPPPPAAAVQLNLLTGKETTKASLTEYMLNTLAPGCV